MTMGVMNVGRDGLSAAKMDRILLPTRHSGVCPGNAPTAAGDWVACSAKVESQILGLGEVLEGQGRLSSALNVLCDNLRGREAAIASSRLSGLEMELKESVEDVADALRAAKADRPGNSRGGNSRLAPTGAPAPPAVAPAETGGVAPDEQIQAAQDGTPPPPIPPTPPPPPPPPPLPPPPPPPPPLDDHGAEGEEGPAPPTICAA